MPKRPVSLSERYAATGQSGIIGGHFNLGSCLLLAVASIVMLAVDRADPERSPFIPLKRAVAEHAAPVMTLITGALRTLDGLGVMVSSNWHASARVRTLERDKRNLLHWRDLALAQHEKMQRYEALLKAPRAPQPVVITARMVSDSGGPFVRARLINAGARDGIARGQAALAYNGLIGRVMNVGRTSARVLMLTDFNSRVPVFVAETGDHAILAGDNSSMPKLVYVARQARLQAGMRVMTSGEDAVLPRGIAVGTLVSAGTSQWRVKMFARPDSVDFVTILSVPPVAAVEEAPQTGQKVRNDNATMSPVQKPPLQAVLSATATAKAEPHQASGPLPDQAGGQ